MFRIPGFPAWRPPRFAGRLPIVCMRRCLWATAPLAILALLALGCGSDSTGPTEEDTTPAEWLRSHAASISVSPDDEDFSDLEPLRQAIGSSRLVLLGEQSHGDGTVFLAKARLIQFLHEEMDFDVLAFESGLYELRKVWELIEGGEEAASAMSKGIFRIWMGSAQLEPLTEYVDESARSSDPLELAGFDCQFTGSASRDHLVDDLERFLTAQGSTLPGDPGWVGFTTDLQALIDGDWWQEKPAEEDMEALDDFLEEIGSEVVQMPPGEEVAFWAQLLESMREQVRFNWEYIVGQWQPEVSSIRDMQMGDNLLWLLREGYPGRKIVVWAATLHNLRRVEEIVWESGSASYTGYTTMGHVVWEGIGTDSYVVGFTAGGGQAGTWFGEHFQLDPPEEGSLEEHFMATDLENAFLDLRDVPTGGEWLSDQLLSRPLGYTYMWARWPRHMDAVIFTRVMEPSTAAD